MTPAPAKAATSQEIEFKRWIPDAVAFDRLLVEAGGRAAPAVAQDNHFFDTATGALAAQRLAFRLRREGEQRFLVTLKGPAAENAAGGPKTRDELEWEIASDVGRAVLADAADPASLVAARWPGDAPPLARALLEAASREPLVSAGWFRNERTRVATALPLPGGAETVSVVLEFDRTAFPGDRVDFEVELEIGPDADANACGEALDALLSRAGVAPRESPSKLSRLREIERAQAARS